VSDESTTVLTDVWGRVSSDGSVFVTTPEGEKLVGQCPDDSPEDALARFKKRYDDLAFEVDLLDQRVRAGNLSPNDANGSVRKLLATVSEAACVGDLANLNARLEALNLVIAERRQQQRIERAKRVEEAKERKEQIGAEAEQIAASNDWRNGANRLRDLLGEWKDLPRLDKGVDDEIWRRFSTARTTYTRRRKAHFSELNEKRDSARQIKERLVVQAEALADSTEWGPTSGEYRELMRQWKAAGPAPKDVDDKLWARFRGAQDIFFAARDAANAAEEAHFAENAVKKEALLVEAEALLPVTDLDTAREAFRSIAERWDAAGKVPRDKIKTLESRLRHVEQEIRSVEDERWRRSNPEARARAADTVAKLESSLADLREKFAKAEANGSTKKAAEHAAAIEAREEWMVEARKALEEFSG
jgi:hypothetical protein